MEQSILRFPKYIFYDDIPVRVISFKNNGVGHYYLGCLCVVPTYQGIGISTQVFHFMLSICSDWKQITLVTPADKDQNIKFYTEKCGFDIGGKEKDGNAEFTEFIMKR